MVLLKIKLHNKLEPTEKNRLLTTENQHYGIGIFFQFIGFW
jgi:hypothetical protein